MPLKTGELAGYHIPKGTTIVIHFAAVQMSTKYWENPQEFYPERFATEDSNRHTFAYTPFSAGPRNCIGLKFAIQEGTILLACLMSSFKVEITEGSSALPVLHPTLHPERLLVKLTSMGH